MAEDKSQDQKTEEPTPRRLEKALEEGQIAFSSELLGGLTLLTGLLFFLLMGRWFFEILQNMIRERLYFMQPMIEFPESILLAIRRNLVQIGWACLGVVAPIITVILMASLLQTRFNLSLKPLELKWKKLSPLQGWKRIFSIRSLNRGWVAVAKATALVLAAYLLVSSQLMQISASGRSSLDFAIQSGSQLILTIGILAAILMVVVGIADYGFQWWKQRQDLKMTLQEVRDENKEMEGDPQVKARIRRVANEISKKRMMQAVPQATVIITNPTHYAVALRYQPEESAAPIVIAKGVDHLALQMIKIGKEHGVAVVERRAVARYLYHQANIGQEIPYEMFQAVAEILNFIQQLDRTAG